MIYIVIFFLWVSFLVYLIMGGADYGSGILELFASGRNKAQVRKDSYHVMGAIWEANHMWLIISVVILFVGFPLVYSTISVYLHLPLLAMLLGIIARGTSLTFRNYDAVRDRWQSIYNGIFVYSSFLTPFFLGVIAASSVSGRIDPGAHSFSAAYINDWVSGFSLATGFFTISLCGFLAAVYLMGDVEPQIRQIYIRLARRMSIAMWIGVLLIFLTAYLEEIPLIHWVFGNWVSMLAGVCSIGGFVILWVLVQKDKIRWTRICAGAMVVAMLIAGTVSHYPDIMILKGGGSVSLFDSGGTSATMTILATALLTGGLFIVPSLTYLVYSFDKTA